MTKTNIISKSEDGRVSSVGHGSWLKAWPAEGSASPQIQKMATMEDYGLNVVNLILRGKMSCQTGKSDLKLDSHETR